MLATSTPGAVQARHSSRLFCVRDILNGTIRYNLTYGLAEERRKTITDQEIWAMMRTLQIEASADSFGALADMSATFRSLALDQGIQL